MAGKHLISNCVKKNHLLIMFVIKLLLVFVGRSELFRTIFAPKSREFDWVLFGRRASAFGLRVHATRKLGEPLIQE